MLKSFGVGGWVGWVVAHVILVSAQGPNPSFFFYWGLLLDLGACWNKGLDSDLDQDLTINRLLVSTIIIIIHADLILCQYECYDVAKLARPAAMFPRAIYNSCSQC